MPEICRFLGIVVSIYYRDHEPPHFHVKYGEYEATVRIDDGKIEGRFPRRATRLVMEWYAMHPDELRENWRLARESKTLKKIEPLE